MSRIEKPWVIIDPRKIKDAFPTGLSYKTAQSVAAKFAALEAERLTSTAEPDALYLAVPMSGGAEPAGAAKPHE